MEEIIKIILEYAAIWGPSLVAVLGTVYTVLVAIGKCKEAADKLKNDTTLKDLGTQFARLAKDNEDLVYTNKLLLDEITKIKGYADAKRREEG